MQRPPLRVALVARTPWDSPSLYALATPGIEFGSLDVTRFGRPEYPNPFGLPVFESTDVVLVSSYWHNWLRTNYPEQVDPAFKEFHRHASTIVGLDSEDAFALLLPPAELDRYALVIKAHGIFRDRDLYNYRSGAPYPGDRWTEKVTRLADPYSDAQLDKLRLGLPFLASDVPHVRRSNRRYERAARGDEALTAKARVTLAAKAGGDLAIREVITHSSVRRRPLDVHCLGSASHTQRIEALRRLEGFSGLRGITLVPKKSRGLVLDSEFTPEHRTRIAEQAAPFTRPWTNRLRYYIDLCKHKIVVAPSGFGELTFRHGEALRAGAALVCPSLEHVELRFPFEDGRNVVWCKTDLSDLRQRVRELLADENRRARIGATGRRDILSWERDWRSVFQAAIAAPLREALGEPAPEQPV